MEKIVLAILVGLGALVAVSALAFFAGTIIWMIWPVTAVNVFHAPALTWWQSVCLTYTCSILLRPSVTVSK